MSVFHSATCHQWEFGGDRTDDGEQQYAKIPSDRSEVEGRLSRNSIAVVRVRCGGGRENREQL